MNRWLRILRHRWSDEAAARRVFTPTVLQRLENRVAASERKHTGEIRVCVEAGLPLGELWRDASARDRAVALFGELGVWDTEANNGVLIYLLLAEQAIEIVADRGLARHVDAAFWDALVDRMGRDFREGRFDMGLTHTLDAVDELLTRHFPCAEGQANPDELPNAPLML